MYTPSSFNYIWADFLDFGKISGHRSLAINTTNYIFWKSKMNNYSNFIQYMDDVYLIPYLPWLQDMFLIGEHVCHRDITANELQFFVYII